MTITSTPSEIAYVGDGVSTVFTIPFAFDTSADLKIARTDTSGNIAVLTSGFSVSGGGGSTGSLTLTAALDIGYTLTILDDPERIQDADYVSNDAFPAESHEKALDHGVRLSKRLWQIVQRCIRTQDGDPISGAGMTLGSVDNRKGKYLFFNAITGAIEYATAVVGSVLSQSIIGQFLNPQTAAEAAAGVTPTNYAYDPIKGDVRRWSTSIVVDGSTDNTTALTNLWTTLSSYKGNVYIPYNTKFTKPTVYASIPANVTLVDDSLINSSSSQPPGYRQRFQMSIEDFGGKANDSTFDNTAAFNRALTFCQAQGYNVLRFPGAGSSWYFKTKPNPIPFGLYIEGENPRAWLVRSYTPGSSTEAFMQWTGAAGIGGDIVKGGGMRHIGLLADTGSTLGIAIDILGTTTVFRPGYMGFDDVVITGNGQWDFGFRMNGQGITTLGSQGQRDVNIRGLFIFRCNLACMQLSNAVHVYGMGIGMFDGGLGGTPLLQITGGGTTTTNTNDIYMLGLENEGNISIQQCLNVHLQGRCSGTLTVDVSAVNVSFVGATGGVANTSTTATIIDPASGLVTGQNITLQGSTAVMGFSSNVANTATAGGGGALPATPTGYIICSVGGSAKKIPYYNT